MRSRCKEMPPEKAMTAGAAIPYPNVKNARERPALHIAGDTTQDSAG